VNTASILVVDDEPHIRRVLRIALSHASYYVTEAKDGREAIETATRERPDLILLDVNMPDMTGIEACSKLRFSFEGPIIMVTVCSSDRDKVAALRSGADDYVLKPFSIAELLARIQAALRRSTCGKPLPTIETPELSVDLERRTVGVRGNRVHLTPKEFEVLRVLVVQQGKAVTYGRLLQIVWGPDYGEETEKVRGVIKRLRTKIEKDPAHPRYIVTEPWFGYRFQTQSEIAEHLRHKS
jgi:two-component system KDP operon response regulator KdpE